MASFELLLILALILLTEMNIYVWPFSSVFSLGALKSGSINNSALRTMFGNPMQPKMQCNAIDVSQYNTVQ